MKNLIITNIKEYENKKRQLKKDGIEKVHVLSDFDRTLTKAFYHGEKAGSLISRLRNGNYLSLEYARKAHELFDYYHPIEIDSNISIDEKKDKMYEWWRKHKELLIEFGLDKQTIESCVKEMMETGIPDFRIEVKNFLQFLYSNNIPLVILSASLEDLIKEFLKQMHVLYNNIHVIGNEFEYNERGKAIAIKRIIHVFNKNETKLEHLPIYDGLLNRNNVILLGDSVGDLGMVEGFPYENLLTIGFLNDNVDENIETYKENFDIIISNDGDFGFVNKLMKELYC